MVVYHIILSLNVPFYMINIDIEKVIYVWLHKSVGKRNFFFLIFDFIIENVKKKKSNIIKIIYKFIHFKLFNFCIED